MSGVTVATMIASTSEGSTPRAARQRLAASTAKSLVAIPGSTMWRSRMPTRL
jgi:NAD(P)H-dependent flavin oxidoreductase YrpB (nitropropane dioxygenase family)